VQAARLDFQSTNYNFLNIKTPDIAPGSLCSSEISAAFNSKRVFRFQKTM